MEVTQKPITGDTLFSLVNSPKPKRPELVEGFLYEKSCIMLAADPGCGKSILTLQLAMSASIGAPLFGILNIPRPLRTYYIQRERPKEEILERMEAMQNVLKWDKHSIVIDDGTQPLSFVKEKHGDFIIRRIMKHTPDIIIIDPLYAGHSGLKDEETVSKLCGFLNILQFKTGASLVINHHTIKSSYTQKGDKIEKDDPFYGSQFIKAFITGSYHVTRLGNGILLTNKKDSHSNLLNKIELAYDHESYTLMGKVSKMGSADRLQLLLRHYYENNKLVSFNEIQAHLGVSTVMLRKLISIQVQKNIFKNVSPPGKKAYYKVMVKI